MYSMPHFVAVPRASFENHPCSMCAAESHSFSAQRDVTFMGVLHARHPPPAGSSEILSDFGAVDSTAVCVLTRVSSVCVNTAQSRCSSLRSGPAGLQETLLHPAQGEARPARAADASLFPAASASATHSALLVRVAACRCVHACAGSHLSLHRPAYVERWASSRACTRLPGSPCPLFGPLSSPLPDVGSLALWSPMHRQARVHNAFRHLAACSLPDFVVSAAGGCFVSSALKS